MLISKPRIAKIALISYLACILPSAHGEDLVDYKVEIILFSHLGSQGAGTERYQEETLWPNLENAVQLSMNSEQSSYRTLSELDKGLGSIAAILNRSSRYKVIMHLVWRQTMLTRAFARPLHIHGGIDFSRQFPAQTVGINAPRDDAISAEDQPTLPLEQVDGTIKLFIGRYLHINTDLIFRQPAVIRKENLEHGRVEQSTILVNYRVRNNRKMRSSELHYLDHPRLGILVQITPLEKSSKP